MAAHRTQDDQHHLRIYVGWGPINYSEGYMMPNSNSETLISFQWNPDKMLSCEYEGYPLVRPTNYMEVHYILGTSGCSRSPNFYCWSVLGVIESSRGKLIVEPGDWVTNLPDGNIMITPKPPVLEGLSIVQLSDDKK